jgi:hypothetical protein
MLGKIYQHLGKTEKHLFSRFVAHRAHNCPQKAKNQELMAMGSEF